MQHAVETELTDALEVRTDALLFIAQFLVALGSALPAKAVQQPQARVT